MIGAICSDRYGNSVTRLMQWDTNQKIVVSVGEMQLPEPPAIHFQKDNEDEVLSVQSEIVEGRIIADIPNRMLISSGNITVYIFLIVSDECRTVKKIQIPVIERPQPPDYFYTDNVEVILLKDLIAEVTTLNTDIRNAEEIRMSNESDRQAAETIRSEQELERKNAEDARIASEEERSSAESIRAEAESNRISNENTRIEFEELRNEQEGNRESAESSRQSNEAARVSAENSRASFEQSRQDAETERETQESIRQANEESRISAEQVREENEENRIRDTSSAIQQCENTANAVQTKLDNGEFVGAKGDTGTIFTPHISSDCVLTWTNDGGLENPSPISIKGDKGADGTMSFDDLTPDQKASLTDFNVLPLVYNEFGELVTLQSKEVLADAFGKIKFAIDSLILHLGDNNNPHKVKFTDVWEDGIATTDEAKSYLGIG